MHEASALVTGATLAAARAVWSSSAEHGASIAGGMHHAMAARASGFGVYNDVAIAIASLWHRAPSGSPTSTSTRTTATGCRPRSTPTRGADDQPAPAPGDPVPFTGLPTETGGPGAEGSAVNVALPAGTAMPAGCVPSTRSSRRCCGSSGRRCWSASTGRHAPAGSPGPPGAEHRRAARRPCRDPRARPRAAGGRWLLTGGEGYELVRGRAADLDAPARRGRRPADRPGMPTPVPWREYVAPRTGLTAPETMTKGHRQSSCRSSPATTRAMQVDRAIMATRAAIFPLHGLMPL